MGDLSTPVVMLRCYVSVIRICCPVGASVRLMDNRTVADLKVSPNCLGAASQVSHAWTSILVKFKRTMSNQAS